MSLFSTLTNRIFLASAALTLLCISTAIYVVNRRVTEAVEDELRRALMQSSALVDEQRQSVSDRYTVFARTVADLPKLKAAVATDDPPTVLPIAADYARTVDANLLLVTDAAGRALAERSQAHPAPPAAGLPSVAAALRGREETAFWVLPGGILQVVSVPIGAGAAPAEIVGSLTLGFEFDDELAARFKAQTGSDIAFATSGRVVASTLGAGPRAGLAALAGASGVSSARLGGAEYLVLVRPLVLPGSRGAGRPPAPGPIVSGPGGEAPAAPIAIILRSRTDRLRLLEPIRAALLGTGLLAVLLAVGLSYGIARTVTRPLAAITTTMREITASGDLERKIAWPESRWKDEDARLLATTFNSLTASLSRFQREAAQRERLSALGRMSTVISHEVRNPLMIIKGSLRALLAESPSPAAVHEAASDIDGEVTRLNRLVNDVLDFAKPLGFDLEPVDLNALCAQCVAAAAGSPDGGLAIRQTLDPAAAPFVTDEERLRSVLVNLIANARHAVEGRYGGGLPAGADPSIEVETRRVEGGVAIEVRDGGAGIEPAALPRVFEPYFTTRRAGTGLGLAIARNIVEGLGGTIRITSRAGAGTRVRIELPDRAVAGPSESKGAGEPS